MMARCKRFIIVGIWSLTDWLTVGLCRRTLLPLVKCMANAKLSQVG